jgi:hypothetical protein
MIAGMGTARTVKETRPPNTAPHIVPRRWSLVLGGGMSSYAHVVQIHRTSKISILLFYQLMRGTYLRPGLQSRGKARLV